MSKSGVKFDLYYQHHSEDDWKRDVDPVALIVELKRKSVPGLRPDGLDYDTHFMVGVTDEELKQLRDLIDRHLSESSSSL